ncbi:hypothetical protein CC79DRAFT_1381399 [Sarocladium strictum]
MPLPRARTNRNQLWECYKPLYCNICHQWFSAGQALDQHMRTHMDVTPWKRESKDWQSDSDDSQQQKIDEDTKHQRLPFSPLEWEKGIHRTVLESAEEAGIPIPRQYTITKAAIKRADESMLQNRSIMVFTAVTILFLPLSFFASVLGMNVSEISKDGIMPLRKQLTLMFGISAAVIFVSLLLAFSTWTRTIITIPLYARVIDRAGWRSRTLADNSTTLKSIQRERLTIGEFSESTFLVWLRLLLNQSELQSWFETPISKNRLEGFKKNLKALLVRFGQGLAKETSKRTEVNAVSFGSSIRAAFKIKDSLSEPALSSEINRDAVRQDLNTYLKTLEAFLELLEEAKNPGFRKKWPCSHCDKHFWHYAQLSHYENHEAQSEEAMRRWTTMEEAHMPLIDKDHEEIRDSRSQHPKEKKVRAVETRRIEPSAGSDLDYTASDFSPAIPDKSQASAAPLLDDHLYSNKATKNTAIESIDRLSAILSTIIAIASGILTSLFCRCGKRLHVHVPKREQASCLMFVQKAAGPDNTDTISIKISDSDSDSSASTADNSDLTGTSSLSASTEECIGKYKTERIPSIKEIMGGQYAMNPCPGTYEDFVISPEVFMHEFTSPGDHTGAAASDALPKKLHSKLLWDKNVNNIGNTPVGWGFYIVEGIEWEAVAWCTTAILIAVTVLTIAWSEYTNDVQGATGIGQFCLGALAVSIALLAFAQGAATGRAE